MGLERIDPTQPGAAPPTGPTFEQFIQGVAAAAKLKIQIKSPVLAVVSYTFAEKRQQNTFVRFAGRSTLGHPIVAFFSPALKLAPAQELNAKSANTLLRRNGAFAHGGWAILTIEGSDYLGMLDTMIADTLQPAEFAAICLAVAVVADAFEKELGADVF